MVKGEGTRWWIGSGGCVICPLRMVFCLKTGWRSVVILLLYKVKGERTECKNYRGVRLLSVVGDIYAGILVSIE